MPYKITVVKGVNDLQSQRPDIAKIIHPFKNGNLKPDELYYKSTKKVWFIYPYNDPFTGKHFDFEWEQPVCNIVNAKNICPYLSKCPHKKYIYPGFNDLYTKQKELVDKEWDWNKNTKDPSTLAEHSQYNAWWKCRELGHSYQKKVCERVYHKYCPECAKSMKTSFPEKAVYFYIKQAFSDAICNYTTEDLGKREIDIFIPSFNTGIEYDGFNAHFDKKEQDELKNEICARLGINLWRIREQCRGSRYLPELLNSYKSFNITDRNYNELSDIIKTIIQALKPGYNIDIDINKDMQKIVSMSVGIHIENSLGTLYPELAKEFSNKNGISPFQISAQSNFKFLWDCPKCGKEYLNSPNRRITDKKGCPVCARQKVIAGVNDVATLDPRILPYWNDPDIKPTEVGPRTTKKVKLKCPDCGMDIFDSLAHVLINKHICQMCYKGKIHKNPHGGSRATPVKGIVLDTGISKTFPNASTAGRYYGVDQSTIFKILKGNKGRTSAKGVTFEYT